MAPWYPVYCRRSDGKLETSKNASLKAPKEKNEPTPEQLNTKPNAKGICDFYRICEPGHGKEIDWRRKLGGMLVRELGSKESQNNSYILSCFPENYRLYEHVRTKGAAVEGGFNERQDSYLYGHPHGRKKRYRSPAEYFPHLLWLATDETGDPNNCSCRICCPEELEVEGEDAKTAPKVTSKVKKEELERKPSLPFTEGQRRPHSTQITPLPRSRNYEQLLDSQYNKYLYRPGEVVWFQRGAAWGLGTVAARIPLMPNAKPQYSVQPLSHSRSYPQQVNVNQDQVRNWLAWSPPPCLDPMLNPHPNNGYKQPSYGTVDWLKYQSHRSATDAEVDGSILAAKQVETTYTLLERMNSSSSAPGAMQTSEVSYNGLYLGAEKIWLGDILRIRNKDPQIPASDLMVLHSIVEHTSGTRSAVLLTGDIYTPTTVPSTTLPTSSPQHPQNQPHIPSRLRADLSARNLIALQSSTNPTAKSATHTLRLTRPATSIAFSAIKGRYYESSLLMPLLNPHYAAQKSAGDLGDCGFMMNGHGDCNKPDLRSAEAQQAHARGETYEPFRPAWVRCKKREEAYGRGVPPSFRVKVQEGEMRSGAGVAGNGAAGAGAGAVGNGTAGAGSGASRPTSSAGTGTVNRAGPVPPSQSQSLGQGQASQRPQSQIQGQGQGQVQSQPSAQQTTQRPTQAQGPGQVQQNPVSRTGPTVVIDNAQRQAGQQQQSQQQQQNQQQSQQQNQHQPQQQYTAQSLAQSAHQALAQQYTSNISKPRAPASAPQTVQSQGGGGYQDEGQGQFDDLMDLGGG